MNREDAIRLLRQMQDKLTAAGETRYPQRSDFDASEISFIKAYLGPFPRALETAGLKPVRDDGKAEKNLEKHIRAKRNRTLEKIKREKKS